MKLIYNFIDTFTGAYRLATIVILMICFFICLYLEKKYDSILRRRRNNK
jgi:hypothetical protein